ncbi:hypothetical protein DPMN_185380 [Dreissena polymorpha]|uniref:Uncharacterized protein n=1 Tax=Dreissena polymorpha TaxID=45954 RepID=A0A9D4DM37_DREPO|nr:hypothetical protein DPMN_185380 [Dreissena polymorpha]
MPIVREGESKVQVPFVLISLTIYESFMEANNGAHLSATETLNNWQVQGSLQGTKKKADKTTEWLAAVALLLTTSTAPNEKVCCPQFCDDSQNRRTRHTGNELRENGGCLAQEKPWIF